jgi:hypothetical protein
MFSLWSVTQGVSMPRKILFFDHFPSDSVTSFGDKILHDFSVLVFMRFLLKSAKRPRKKQFFQSLSSQLINVY